jgi:WD40 repeat protein
VIAAGTAKPVRVWNAVTGREVCQLDHDGRYAFFVNPNQIITLGRQNKVCRWRFPDGTLLSASNFRGCLTTGAQSQVRDLAIYVTKTSPTVFDLSSRRDVWTLPTKSNTFCVAISNDGTLAVTGESSGVARLWSVSSRKEIRQISRFKTYVQACAISPDKSLALVASWDKTTRLVNLNTGSQVRSHSRTNSPMSATFSPDGRLYAVGCQGRILIWETETGSEVASISAHRNKYIESLSFSADGSRLLSGGADGTVCSWQLALL